MQYLQQYLFLFSSYPSHKSFPLLLSSYVTYLHVRDLQLKKMLCKGFVQFLYLHAKKLLFFAWYIPIEAKKSKNTHLIALLSPSLVAFSNKKIEIDAYTSSTKMMVISYLLTT